MSIEQAFGEVVKELRLSKELSQEQLAEKTGLHRTYISILERGLKSPSLSTIYRLSSVLGIQPYELLLLVSKKNPANNVK